MLKIFTKTIFALIASYVIFLQPVLAVKIVRLEIEYGSDVDVATSGFDIPKTFKVLDLELFDDVSGLDLQLFDGLNNAPAPVVTVANYLNYVNSGRYDDTFFTRSISDFVLQAGGAVNKPTDPENDTIVVDTVAVEDLPPIVNEPGISNTRGTIAMARVGGQINSATNEWFVNLSDNTPLDTFEEGFTAFGSVIDDGMVTIDQLTSFPVTGFFGAFRLFSVTVPGTSFDALPYADTNFEVSGELFRRNLLLITKATEINRPILRFSPSISNFGSQPTDSVSIGKPIDVVLKNTGNEILEIGTIDEDLLDLPFSIESEDCSNTTLTPVSAAPPSSCMVRLKFLPSSIEKFTDDLIVNYTSQVSGELFSVKYPLIGEGGVPGIEIVDTFDITSQVGGFSTTKNIFVENAGQASLKVLNISGLDSTNFSQTNNCIGNNVFVAPGESCSISVNFGATEFGTKVATLLIESDDPVNNIVSVALSGHGDNDADGITTGIEDSAPNTGDYNFDGNSDSVQNGVASFASETGEYLSLVVSGDNAKDNNIVSNLSLVAKSQLIDLPDMVDFKHGAIEYDVVIDPAGVANNGIIEIGLILPLNDNLVGYYFHGETVDNATPHWYEYQPVQVFANATLTSSNGKQLKRDFIKFTVQDGGPGDADQLVNGRVVLALGAPAYLVAGSGDSGSSALSFLFLSLFTVFLVAVKTTTNRSSDMSI